MDTILLEFILVLILIIIAGYLAAAEIAIASFGANKIEELKEKHDNSAIAFEKIQKDTNTFFGMIQLSTTLFLVLAYMLAFHLSLGIISPWIYNLRIYFISDHATEASVIFTIITMVILTLLLTILIPKSLGFKYSERIGKASVKFLLFMTSLFKYPVKLITDLGNFLLFPLKEKTNFSQTRFSEDEIRIIISEGVKSGALNETEQEIIENIFEFNDLRAYEVMIPRTEMIALEFIEDSTEIKEEIIKTQHSLIPVYEGTADNIIGILHTKDFMRSLVEGNPVTVKSIIRPAYFVPESKLISEILKEMQKRGERLAIVMDEYGGTEGIITMEDILEEIVGEFIDSKEAEQKEYSRLQDGKYYVLGSMTIYDFNETFNMNLPESDEYNTVAGFIADKSGRILNTGDIVQHEDLIFELIKKLRQKMVQFKVYSLNNDFVESKLK